MGQRLTKRQINIIRITSIYLVFSTLWIIAIKDTLKLFNPGTSTLQWFQQNETIVFSLFSVVLIFILLTTNFRRTRYLSLEAMLDNFTLIFDNAPNAIFLTDANGVLLDINNKGAQIYQLDKQQLIGTNIIEKKILPAEQLALAEKLLAKTSKGIPTGPTEFTIQDEKGNNITFRIYTYPVKTRQSYYTITVALDVSQEKTAEREFIHSESKYRTLIENLPQGIFMKDTEHRYVSSNERFAQDMGLKAEDIIGKTDEELRPNDLAQRYNEDDQRILKTGKTEEIIEEFSEEQGERYIKTLKAPVYNDKGEINGLLGFYWDVTQTRQYEKIISSISKSILGVTGKNFFRSLVKSIGEGLNVDYVFVGQWHQFDPKLIDTVAMYSKGKISGDFNYTLKGTPCENVLGKETCFYPEGVQNLFPKDSLLQEMNIQSYYGAPLFNSKGLPLGLLVIMNETPIENSEFVNSIMNMFSVQTQGELERLKVEKALRESENKYRTILETIPDAVTTTDLSGRITYASPMTCQIHGFASAGEMLGKSFHNLVVPTEYDRVSQDLEQIKKEGQIREEEFEMLRKDNTSFDGEVTVSLLRDSGHQPIGFIAISKDISKRKESESKLKRLNSALTLAEEQERKRIADNLHDNVSQPLAMAKLKLSEGIMAAAANEHRIQLEKAKEFLNDAIEKSRRITYELSPPILYELGITEAIKWKLDLFEKQNNIKASFTQIGQIPTLKYDLLILIFRSFNELLTNIIKHAEANHIIVKLWTDKELLHLYCEDNGKGFELPVEVTISKENSGFGLLSIKERLDNFKGHIHIDSRPGNGTKVQLQIPIQKNEEDPTDYS